jgi:hypothetical protein
MCSFETTGNCRGDHECADGLRCFPRSGRETVEGCEGAGIWGVNYCAELDYDPILVSGALVLEPSCSPTTPCDVCHGECQDDRDCKAGLSCLIRTSVDQPVPGCVTGINQVSGNVCYEAPENGLVTFYPGNLTVVTKDGLLLSTGLSATVIAQSGYQVNYTDGAKSQAKFHSRPNGAATFLKEDGSWLYVSNSQDRPGGVGVLHFNTDGEIVNYEMIATNTVSNSGGGKTWWDT